MMRNKQTLQVYFQEEIDDDLDTFKVWLYWIKTFFKRPIWAYKSASTSFNDKHEQNPWVVVIILFANADNVEINASILPMFLHLL